MTVLLDMAVSLDGSISTAGGEDGGLHDWYFDPTPPSQTVIDELIEQAGSLLLGRNAFGAGDDAEGWDDTPYRVPHIVLTHRPPSRPVPGGIDFRFVTDLGGAVTTAIEAAGDGVVALGGGADIARQCLALGLVDEIQLHVVPVVLNGPRLLDGLCGFGLTKLRVVDAPNVTHLRYRVQRP